MNARQQFLILIALIGLTATIGACREMPSNSGTGSGPQQGASNEDSQYIQMLADLKRKHPTQDAQAAVARGERYFLCNAGRSRTVPGLKAEVYANAQGQCPTRCLDGVTDAIVGNNHSQYLSAALDYSALWNQEMIKSCY
jgi:hypothetical protein